GWCRGWVIDRRSVVIGNEGQAKLFGGYTTRTRLSTLTSSTFFTCASVIGASTTCTGRRKRRALSMTNVEPQQNVEIEELSSSHNIEERSTNDDKGKLFIGLTTFTTITTTSYAVNTATTVSISYSCLPLGDTVPALCG
ncbi:unnamed protein product, partial [Meganyctiphanes norvegica]